MKGRALSDITISRDLTIKEGKEFDMDRDQLFGLIEVGSAEFAEKDENKLSPTDRALLKKLRDSQDQQVGKTPDPEATPQPQNLVAATPAKTAPASTPVAKPVDAPAG
jgi:hypothetical protein